MAETKFCRDCKHYESVYVLPQAFCRSPNIPVDMVTGRHLRFPGTARRSWLECSPDAKWFEPKAAPEQKRPWWRIFKAD